MISRSGPGRIWIRELAWLLGSRAFSWALLSWLWGSLVFLSSQTMEIQLPDTYFVFQPLLLTTLVFLPIATVATGGRVLIEGFRHFAPNAVLMTLASLWTLLVAVRVLLG